MNLPLKIATVTALLATLAAAPAPAPAAGDWQQVGTDSRTGFSGLAAEDAGTALVAHDNKRPGQPRLARLHHGDGSATLTPVVWDGAHAEDVEAVEAVPGMPGEYLALAARGIVYRLKVTGDTATVVDYAPLPMIGEGADFESFAVVARGGKLAALWADRGEGPGRPATLYAAPLSFASWGQPLFGAVTRRSYASASPAGEGTRHISDITVTPAGRILVGSAADAGDDGPFDSAVSDAGRVTVSVAGSVRVALAANPTVLGTFPGYKIEAVECLPGTGDALLGTDDENKGGFVRTAPYCGA